jgi:rRNA pseudouridine-1189 N-methylase Emg1 (Nep1/Mra1 family)
MISTVIVKKIHRTYDFEISRSGRYNILNTCFLLLLITILNNENYQALRIHINVSYLGYAVRIYNTYSQLTIVADNKTYPAYTYPLEAQS